MKAKRLVVALFCAVMALSFSALGAEPLRVLLLSGKNNHKWKETTPELVSILDQSGRFKTHVLEDPAKIDARLLANFDVVVSNWSNFPSKNREWGADGEKAFLDFLRGGKGFALFHAASACLYDWPEYQQMVGSTWGKDTGHGPVHAFKVTVSDKTHPITKGLGDFWTTDELWHRTQKQPQINPLIQAFSAKDKKGSGANEPLALWSQVGDGRCYNLVLGHDVRAMRNPGWQALMLRGIEWAATGKVTQPAPKNLPTTEAAAEAAAGDKPAKAKAAKAGADPDAALNAIADYQFGQSRAPLRVVENLVYASATAPRKRAKLAGQLTALLLKDSTVDCKKFLLQQLSLIGDDAQVPALAKLLLDPALHLGARETLKRLATPAARAALRDALAKATDDNLKIGLMQTLGDLRDAESVEALAAQLQGGGEVAAAALEALGEIAGPEADAQLHKARGQLPAELQPELAGALLKVAETIQAAGALERARTLYAELSAPAQPAHIRAAALPGRLVCTPGQGTEILLAALRDKERAVNDAAIAFLYSPVGKNVAVGAAAALPQLPAPVRAQVIGALARCGDRAVAPAVKKAATDENADVRQAALKALAVLGDASCVGLLLDSAAKGEAGEQAVARQSLAALTGKEIDAALVQALGSATAPARVEAINALGVRGAVAAAPALVKAAADEDESVRKSAVKALGELGGETEIAPLLQLLGKASSSGERSAAERALSAVCRRLDDPDRAVDRLLDGAKGMEGEGRLSLVAVLGKVGGAKALQALRVFANQQAEAERLAALRALADWPDAAPLDDLLALAESSKGTARTLALRGFAGLAGKPGAPDPAKLAADFAKALKLAETPADKKLLTGKLGLAPHPAALEQALASLDDAQLADEAALAIVQLGQVLRQSHKKEVRAALQKARQATANKQVQEQVAALLLDFDKPLNLALGATASSPDGWEKDGQADGDRAGIDGDPNTYWDEDNGKELYRYRVEFRQSTLVSALSLTGYQHHSFAARDFEILCDDKVVKKVQGAKYTNNKLNVTFDETRCRALELKITGYYGASPAIRELEIYNLKSDAAAEDKDQSKAPAPAEPKFSMQQDADTLALLNHGKVVWRHVHRKTEGKPYFHPVSTLGGVELTNLRPGDHVWHRALWFSWKHINGLNYWEEDKKTGLSQGLTEIVDVKTTPRPDRSALLEMTLSYHPPDQPELLAEKRRVAISAPDASGAYLMDWLCVFTARDKEVLLDRTPIPGEKDGKGYGGYAGLSLRMAAATKGWQELYGEVDAKAKGQARFARWLDFSGPTPDGGAAGIAVFDHPDNPRHPAPWYFIAGMPYFSPALLYYEPMTLAPGQSLTLKYRVLIHPGKGDKEELENQWQAWAKQ